MKQLLFIILFATTTIFAKAQSGTGTIDATDSIGIAGGDGTGYIASIAWTFQSGPGTIVFSAPNKAKTDVTITKVGDYVALLTIKDNLGNIATSTYPIKGYLKQSIFIKATVTPIKITIQ
jgi:hypothetical protein